MLRKCVHVGQKFGNGKILVFVSVMVYVFFGQTDLSKFPNYIYNYLFIYVV